MSKAFVFLNCDLGTERNVVDEMKSITGVSHAMNVSGIYDIVAELDSDTEDGISKIVRRMRLISNIKSSITMVVAEKNSVQEAGR
ncbi:MAG TPA: Lrp/AsnC family transcriptional regulator [Nitrososphaera sp.]|jgi:hypothetical protein|nr:Lrp/AsnC family transcriptional regulator [Nitrososphaera sp.]